MSYYWGFRDDIGKNLGVFFVGKKGIIVVEGVGDFFWFSFGKLRGILCVFLFLLGGGWDGDYF
jgi:hypothetical protein